MVEGGLEGKEKGGILGSNNMNKCRGEEAHHICPIFQEKTKLHEEPGKIKLERQPDHQLYISKTFSN